MDEGRKRVLAIVAGILVARHLKTTEDLFDSKPSPRTESLVASAVQWAERIMKKIDGVYRERTRAGGGFSAGSGLRLNLAVQRGRYNATSPSMYLPCDCRYWGR